VLLPLWERVQEWALAAWQRIAEWGAAFWEWVRPYAQAAWDLARDLASAVWQKVSEWAALAWEFAAQSAAAAWQHISDFAVAACEAVSALALEVWDRISAFAEDAWEVAKAAAADAWRFLTEDVFIPAWERIEEFAKSVLQSMSDFWESLPFDQSLKDALARLGQIAIATAEVLILEGIIQKIEESDLPEPVKEGAKILTRAGQGAIIGGQIGSFIPGVGAPVGAAVGAIFGAIFGALESVGIFQEGGLITQPGLAFVHAPELILPIAEAKPLSSLGIEPGRFPLDEPGRDRDRVERSDRPLFVTIENPHLAKQILREARIKSLRAKGGPLGSYAIDGQVD